MPREVMRTHLTDTPLFQMIREEIESWMADHAKQDVVPDMHALLSTLETEPAINPGFVPEKLDALAVGLSPYDVTSKIHYVTAPTTPDVPSGLCATGFKDQIGLSWKIGRFVANVR